ncbi:diaminopimelate epimerase [Negadavirga shengliensis]|uniref:Diaminopimelate epimerase n=1 Tax=Negadavirga shengliensis TaxID=1389218 RepID=A0ABV9SW30_9BACT
MNISFYKYQGTGNDFVMIDDRKEFFDIKNLALVQRLCDRRFGIGADGLILIRNKSGYDFEMVYFNADGSQSMCGNGARCAAAFAAFLGIVPDNTYFYAIDGPHRAKINNDWVALEMGAVQSISKVDGDYFVNTGSPHHVRFVDEVETHDVVTVGRDIRYSQPYQPGGTNVNFVTPQPDHSILVRTYERGVEDETLSCGTGVTACALVYGQSKNLNHVKIKTRGGELEVSFISTPDGRFEGITLSGPAKQVFSGIVKTENEISATA